MAETQKIFQTHGKMLDFHQQREKKGKLIE